MEIAINLRLDLRLLVLVWPSVSHSVRLQDSLVINIFKKSQLILHGDSCQRKVKSVTTTFAWMWPGLTHLQLNFLIF